MAYPVESSCDNIGVGWNFNWHMHQAFLLPMHGCCCRNRYTYNYLRRQICRGLLIWVHCVKNGAAPLWAIQQPPDPRTRLLQPHQLPDQVRREVCVRVASRLVPAQDRIRQIQLLQARQLVERRDVVHQEEGRAVGSALQARWRAPMQGRVEESCRYAMQCNAMQCNAMQCNATQ